VISCQLFVPVGKNQLGVTRLNAESPHRGSAPAFEAQKKVVESNESSGIGKEDLREVQGDYAPRCGACDLRERKAQAAPGISKAW
jgi:hypothetical protein